jgi:NAD+ synthase
MHFRKDILRIDAAGEAVRLVSWLRHAVRDQLHRRGAVVGISGGVDSAVVLVLCVNAFGLSRVIALLLQDRDSLPESDRLAHNSAVSF